MLKSLFVEFNQTGSGAVRRSVQDKLRDLVSVKDFGASEGATAAENTTAFNLAKAAGTPFVPAGTYAISGTVTGAFYSLGTVTIMGGTVSAIYELSDGAAQVADYTALRAYSGASKSVYVTGYSSSAAPSGIAGLFTRDDSDTTSADNGGTVIVASNGKRWKRVFSGPASVLWFGAKGDDATNDTAAVTAAYAAHRHVRFPAGYTFRVNLTTAPPSNRHFVGEGETSVLKPYDVTARMIDFDSGGTSSFITDLRFSRLKFAGTVTADGFLEQAHLAALRGVKRLRVKDCYFEGARGDGLYLGGDLAGVERHNHDVLIDGCIFDGLNNQNRNGLSVIDVNGLHVQGCTFRNWAKSDMPGSIDFEPNYSFGVIKNVSVIGNKFSACNGNRGHVAFCTNNTSNDNVYNLVASGNDFEGNIGVALWTNTTVATKDQGIVILGNAGRDCTSLAYSGNGSTLYGVTLTANRVNGTTTTTGALFTAVESAAGSDSTKVFKNITIVDNDVVTGSAVAIQLPKPLLQYVTINDNRINGSTQAHVLLSKNGGATEYVVINDNTLLGSPTRLVQHDPDAHNPATNEFLGNIYPVGAAHNFRALRTDDCGQITNPFSVTSAPNAYPRGDTMMRVSSSSLGVTTGTDVGVLYTHRPSNTSEASSYQEFVPEYGTSNLGSKWIRKAIDATNWGPWTLVGNAQVSADKGDAAATLTYRSSEPTARWATPLTDNRAVTLDTTKAVNGAKFRIVRTAAATGASSLNVGTGPLKALAAGQWCDVEYDGSAWLLTAFGSL